MSRNHKVLAGTKYFFVDSKIAALKGSENLMVRFNLKKQSYIP